MGTSLTLVATEAFVCYSNDNDGQDESTNDNYDKKLNGQSTVEDHTKSTMLLEFIYRSISSKNVTRLMP